MNIDFLISIGLSRNLAIAYLTILRSGLFSARELATAIKESRTNTYNILDKLVTMGLVIEDKTTKKNTFRAANPVALEALIKNQRDQALERERLLKAQLPNLLTYYYTHNDTPGIQYFHGNEGIIQVYQDQLISGKDITFVKSSNDVAFVGQNKLHKIRNQMAAKKIKRIGITQDIQSIDIKNLPTMSTCPTALSYQIMGITRTWIDPSEYTSNVEWSSYGDKLSIISFTEDPVAIIIHSAQIAESFRQLFTLLSDGIKRKKNYREFPKKLTKTAMPDSLKLKRYK